MKLVKALFVIIILLVITNVTLTNRSVDDGLALSNLTKEITQLKNENTIKKTQIASAGSLSIVKEKIAAAGFVETPKMAALGTPSSVALR